MSVWPVQGETQSVNDLALRNAQIQAWLDADAAFKTAQSIERDNRARLSTMLFPVPKKGTQRFPLFNGFAIKLVHSLRYTLGDKDKVDDSGMKVTIRVQISELQDRISALSPQAELLADRLIKWNPELSVSEYELLDGDNPEHIIIRGMIDEVLTVKAAMPELTFEEPKA